MIKGLTTRSILCCKNVYIVSLILMFLSISVVCAKEYANCYTLDVDLVASQDYLEYKNRVNVSTTTVDVLNRRYNDFIQLPNLTSSSFLFLVLKNDVNFIKTGYLSCGFNNGDSFECESNRLWGNDSCATQFVEKKIVDGNEQTQTYDIENCEYFDKQNVAYNVDLAKTENERENLKPACYPQNHICNKYKENEENIYFSIDGKYLDESGEDNNVFYIYKKNVVKEGENKTCDFEVYPCDLKVKNELSGYVNVVFNNTVNKYNRKFVENIFSGYDENKRFFDYVGTIKQGDAKYEEIMKASYYYKYVNSSADNFNSNTKIYYYTKNLNGLNKSEICNGYLPNCKYLLPKESNEPLYNNLSKNNNVAIRNNFYGSSKANVREENLWFVNNDNFVNSFCLAIKNGSSSNSVDYDIGYCSDLNDDLSELKYKSGLQYDGKGNPNCYLKSCIDLTPEELSAIVSEDGEGKNKYCSEYYWLNNKYNFKYFPKEKPSYCSDLTKDNFLKYATSDGNELSDKNQLLKYRYCKDGGGDSCKTWDYYSYGGGRNSTKSNCYLKNCFSLNDAERKVVANANATNIGFELEKNGISFNRNDLPKYCDNGFLFNSKMDEYRDFDYLNLNVIPCFDFSSEQLNVISNKEVKGRMLVFTDLLTTYDTNSKNVFCRTHYKPLNSIDMHDERSNFLETTYVIADEVDRTNNNNEYLEMLNNNYNNYYNDIGKEPFENLKQRQITDYRKIKFSEINGVNTESGDYKDATINIGKYLFSNVCSYVDNSFLYYNADAWDLQHGVLSTDSNAKISEAIDYLQKNNAKIYYDCKNKADSNNSKTYDINDSNMPPACKKCNSKVDKIKIDKCLYETDGCKVYAYDYGCKVCAYDYDCKVCAYDYDCKVPEKKEDRCFEDDGETVKNKYCFLKDNISEYVFNCKQYMSEIQVTNYFDCSLFTRTDDAYKDIYDSYLGIGKVQINSKNETTLKDVDFAVIHKYCDENKPLTDNRVLPEPDPLYALIKPFKSGATKVYDASGVYGKNDVGRYGCAIYREPVDVTSVLDSNLWGCKASTVESSYISKYDGERINYLLSTLFGISISNNKSININNQSFKDGFKQPYLAQMNISVCSRYPKNIYSQDNCGQRGDSGIKDKCLSLTVGGDEISDTLEEADGGSWYIESGTGGSRFRYEQHGRDVLVFRDFYTYYRCTASNYPDYYYYDSKSAGLITAEAIGLGTAIGAVVGLAGCGICALALVGWGPCCAIVVAAAIATAIATSITSMMLARTEEYNLSLQNNFYYPHEYYGVDDNYGEYGFLNKANITNNDNYIYRYYKRADTVEEDLKNKLESNVDYDSDSTRFFFGNTLSKDIIKKCKIQNLFGITGNCIGVKPESGIDKDERQIMEDQIIQCSDNGGYNYTFFVLNDDGSRTGEKCKVDKNETPEKCLQESHIRCLAGYGVKFIFNSEIDNDFVNRDGGFLRTYIEGDSIASNWGTNTINNFDWVPVSIVPYTLDISDKQTLKQRKGCSLKKYGDAYGTLAECRGFEYTDKNGETFFYTESQSVKLPLFSSPVFFYTLITARNIPELFNPTLSLKYFYLFSNYKNGTIGDSNKTEYEDPNRVILDFFNPKLQYDYDFVGGTTDANYVNKLASSNNFIAEIKTDKQTSAAYEVVYKSDIFTDTMSYAFALEKVYSKDFYNSYTPKVCLYQIKKISENDLNNTLNVDNCTNVNSKGCLDINSNERIIITDNNVECYARAIPFLTDFVFFQSPNISYNNPVINVFLKPDYLDINEVIKDKDVYMLISGEVEDVTLIAENVIQGFGLNFERSYCSKAYYDYYRYLDLLERELSKTDGRDLSKINLYRKNISSIESAVIPDCKKENGDEVEVLINENEIRTFKDVNGDKTKVIAKEIVKIRKNNELYGGFNEVCVAEKDINNILTTYNKQRGVNRDLGTVLVYRDVNKTQRRTKCVLNDMSRKKRECLVANTVYVYCKQEEIGESYCLEKLDIDNNKIIHVKSIDCTKYLKGVDITEDNIEEIQACYKGGFNSNGNVYKKLQDNPEKEISCSCEIAKDEYNKNLYTERTMTAREYGLCVNLLEPQICPAVRYYDSTKEYVDDNLALGKTEEELKDNPEYYEQHEWRTNERQVGILPSVFYSYNLGNAEFPSSVYCGADKNLGNDYYDKNCIGGKIIVEGECNGFWKENISSAPLATCVAKQTTSGSIIYEYELQRYPCERYVCPSIGYNNVGAIVDEQDIAFNEPNMFTSNELDAFSKIKITDYSSFVNNEEVSIDSVDIRGSSNGFAIWQGQVSNDFAQVVTSKECLTGFAPAGMNYLLRNSFELMNVNNSQNYNINYTYASMHNSENSINRDSLILLYRDRKADYRSLLSENNGKYPQRRCNQYGEWMVVQDPYNLVEISGDIFENNYYYNDNSNAWVLNYDKQPDELGLVNNRYCERLICDSISSDNKNYFVTEFLSDDKKSKNDINAYKSYYSVWKHSGGAFWDRISAPRNSSDDIVINGEGVVSYGDSSRFVNNIFSTTTNDYVINNKYKYVKKVYGVCETEYGYYNRDSFFVSSDFNKQLNYLREIVNDNLVVNPRLKTLLTNKTGVTKPSRHCTSIGLWSGVFDPCFRACEMMDIYHTEFDNILYSNENNLKASNKYFVENNNILTINTNGNLEDNEMENKFKQLNLDSNNLDRDDNGYSLGDYLTGGAIWPRSIVDINSKIETSGDKKGLRYIEIETNCDSSFAPDDERIRQFVSNGLKPKRKCYEDGTWGPVYGDTRCILSKNCKDFNLTLRDLTELMWMYNNGRSGYEINYYISQLAYNSQQNSIAGIIGDNKNNTIANSIIYGFSATNTSITSSVSYNVIDPISSGYTYGYTDMPNKQNSLTQCVANDGGICSYASICNMSQANDLANVAGWSLNFVNDKDIGKYFKPVNCSSNYSNDNFKIDNIVSSGLINRLVPVYNLKYNNKIHYAKESNLNYAYNTLVAGYESKLYPNTQIEDESYKEVNIGESNYNSYQLYYHCNDYFYNPINTSSPTSANSYYDKNIILECKVSDIESDVKSGKGRFDYHADSNNDIKSNIIKADACLPKTCGISGNIGSGNIYQTNGWTGAVIKEIIEGSYGVNNAGITNTSILKCEPIKVGNKTINTAFVIKNQFVDSNVITQYMVGDIKYGAYGFYSQINGTCVNNVDNNINGKNIDMTSYNYRRFGEINVNGLSRTFCKDIDKTRCSDVTDDDLFRSSAFTNAITNTNTNSGYCIPMACPGKNLKFDDANNKIISNATDGNIFHLRDEYYKFGDIVVIESMSGDYAGKNKGKDPNHTYVQYGAGGGTAISGNLCQNNQDIYNEGLPADYSVYQYLTSGSASDNASQCFNNLDNNSISKKNGNCPTDYDNINNKVCVKYSDSYEDKTNLENLTKLKENLNDYKPNETELKNKVAEYIVNKIIFDGIKVREDSDFVSQANVIVNSAEKTAVKNTNNYVNKVDGDGADFSYLACYYADNGYNPNNIEIVDNTSSFDIIQKYNEIVGNNNSQFYKYGDKVGILANKNENICNDNIEIYTITSSATGFYKVKDESMCVNSSHVDSEGNYIKDSGYIKSDATTCEYAIDGSKYITTYDFDIGVFRDGDTYTDAEGFTWKKDSIGETVISATTEICIDGNNENILTNSSYTWQNTNEVCSNTYNNGVKVAKKEPVDKCFYDIDENGVANSSVLMSGSSNIDCGDVDSDICNNAKNSPLNETSQFITGVTDNSSHTIGVDMWIPSYLTTTPTCAPGYYFTKSTVKINGNGFISLDDYMEHYEYEYELAVKNAKEDLVKTITTNGSTGGDYRYVFEEYYNIFYLQGFFENENNLNLYNTYESFTDTQENESLVLNISKDGITHTFPIDNTSMNMYLYNQNGLSCNKIVTDETGAVTSQTDFSNESDCINFINKSKMRTKFDEVFKKNKEDIINSIGDKNTKDSFIYNLNKSISSCNNIYIDYINEKTSFDSSISESSANYNSGLFMAMHCTPEGWMVFDQPSCKSRCNASKTVRLDPTGTGDWHVVVNVSNLRYTKTAEAYFASHADDSCHKNKWTDHARVKFGCNDSGGYVVESESEATGVLGWRRWYDFPEHECSANTYFRGDGTDVDCNGHWWTQTCSDSAEQVFACATDGGHINVVGSHTYNGHFGPGRISTIIYEIKRR